MKNLKKYRQEIDAIDDQLVSLLNKRMEVACKLADVKIEHDLPPLAIEREKEIIKRLKNRVDNPLLKDGIEPLFNSIFDLAKTLSHLKRRKNSPFKRIGIIGHGIIGGSIIKALKAKSAKTTISTIKRESLDFKDAYKSGLIDKAYNNLSDLIDNVDLVILATPISKVVNYAKQISKLAKKPLLVMDVASVKVDISDAFKTLTNEHVELIATHPMSGSEKKGFLGAQANLFINAPWIITAHKQNSQKGLNKVKEFIAFLGAKPKNMDPLDHDKKKALISHVPAIISKSYFDYVKKVFPGFEKIQGPGFLSFTRIAKSNPRMRKEIAEINKKAIANVLSKWMEQFK